MRGLLVSPLGSVRPVRSRDEHIGHCLAFTSVAGQTIAIGGAFAALVITVVSPRTRNIPGIVFFALLAVVVTANAVMAMGATGQLLLDRLDQLAEIAALN